MEKSKLPRFIFVGGSSRSGTTLLQRILTSHSRIGGGYQFSGNEFNFTHDIFHLYERMKNGWKESEAEFFISSNDELSENFRKFYHSFFNRQKFEKFDYVSEKVPKNILVAHSLMEIFPDAYFINIYRDGRDVLASHYQIMQR
ncbi:MAG: sulfotransferase, partial [Bacteroidetes bacterium]|nr:sulfotransferase [Bacteroidota bacterium]